MAGSTGKYAIKTGSLKTGSLRDRLCEVNAPTALAPSDSVVAIRKETTGISNSLAGSISLEDGFSISLEDIVAQAVLDKLEEQSMTNILVQQVVRRVRQIQEEEIDFQKELSELSNKELSELSLSDGERQIALMESEAIQSEAIQSEAIQSEAIQSESTQAGLPLRRPKIETRLDSLSQSN